MIINNCLIYRKPDCTTAVVVTLHGPYESINVYRND